MSRTFKFDLLLAITLSFAYYLLVLLFSNVPALWDKLLSIMNPFVFDPYSFALGFDLVLFAIPCIIMAFKRTAEETGRFIVLFIAALFAIFFGSGKFTYYLLPHHTYLLLPIIAALLGLGWFFYWRGRRAPETLPPDAEAATARRQSYSSRGTIFDFLLAITLAYFLNLFLLAIAKFPSLQIWIGSSLARLPYPEASSAVLSLLLYLSPAIIMAFVRPEGTFRFFYYWLIISFLASLFFGIQQMTLESPPNSFTPLYIYLMGFLALLIIAWVFYFWHFAKVDPQVEHNSQSEG